MSTNGNTSDFGLAIDAAWVSNAAYLIFLMQIEAGFIRNKNVISIFIKNILDICADTIMWWLLGYGFAFGDDVGGFIGKNKFAGYGITGIDYVNWVFQWAFAGTSATIVSGCVAERMTFLGYLLYSVFMCSWQYPVVVHWVWGKGWLQELDVIDFAGCGVVHMTGSVSGLILTKIIGPRRGRYDKSKKKEFLPQNIPYVVLGSLLLWFAWYGFNAGSTLGVVDQVTHNK